MLVQENVNIRSIVRIYSTYHKISVSIRGGETKYGVQTGTWDTSHIDIVGDIIDIDVPNESFDVILCTEVLEHIEHPELAIKEFSRILKPEGKLILTAPFCSFTHFAPYHYSTGFNLFWYKEIFRDEGLTIEEYERNGDFFSYMSQEIDRSMHFPTTKKDIKLVIGARILKSSYRKHSQKSQNHGDLACFGYHILAKKG